jgi:hypothetical protein
MFANYFVFLYHEKSFFMKPEIKKEPRFCTQSLNLFLLSIKYLFRVDINMKRKSWAPVAHACNPSYSGGRDLEDHGSKPAQANSLLDLS